MANLISISVPDEGPDGAPILYDSSSPTRFRLGSLENAKTIDRADDEIAALKQMVSDLSAKVSTPNPVNNEVDELRREVVQLKTMIALMPAVPAPQPLPAPHPEFPADEFAEMRKRQAELQSLINSLPQSADAEIERVMSLIGQIQDTIRTMAIVDKDGARIELAVGSDGIVRAHKAA